MDDQQIINLLKNGEIGVIPTDTIYGIVGSALNEETVDKIYRLRKRSLEKPMIILISSLDNLKKFDITLTDKQKEFLQKNWPNPLSVVLTCSSLKFQYLHRETFSLAFRMPKNDKLIEIIKRVGPVVAPSANFEGEKPCQNLDEAKKYFGDQVALYISAGEIRSQPSTLIELKDNGSYIILRQGSFNI